MECSLVNLLLIYLLLTKLRNLVFGYGVSNLQVIFEYSTVPTYTDNAREI